MKISQTVWPLRLHSVRVTPESLAHFMVMDGIEPPLPRRTRILGLD